MFLPIKLKPLKDEILSSWLIRLSIANGMEPVSFTNAIFSEQRFWNKDIDRKISDKCKLILSKTLSLNTQDIENMTLEPLIKSILPVCKIDNRKMWLFVIPLGQRGGNRANGLHFCPQCLAGKTPYLKKQWKLAWNVGCPTHNIKLMSECEKCGKVFSPHLITYYNPRIYICPNCGFDLRKSKQEAIDKEILLFQEVVNKSLFNNITDINLPLIKYNQQDLLITFRFFISFFKHVYGHKKYNLLFNKINVNKDYMFKSQKGVPFEIMNIDDRIYFMFLLKEFFKIPLEEIKRMILKLNISSKTFCQISSVSSPTIEYLIKFLGDGSTKSSIRTTINSIKPKSKQEIDKLMFEIEKFLQ